MQHRTLSEITTSPRAPALRGPLRGAVEYHHSAEYGQIYLGFPLMCQDKPPPPSGLDESQPPCGEPRGRLRRGPLQARPQAL